MNEGNEKRPKEVNAMTKITSHCAKAFFILLGMLVIFPLAGVLHAKSEQAVPPFDWYETYLLENDSLIIEEVTRTRGTKGSIITYKIKAEGFDPEKPIVLWKRNGGDFSKYEYNLEFPVEMSNEVMIEINFQIENFKKGQALDIALASEDTTDMAHNKIFPFPLRAKGTGGCSVHAELWSRTGHLFLMVFKGFDPGEKVRVMNRLGRWMETSVTEASDEGTVYYCAGFSRRAQGTAMISAFTCDRKVSMEFEVGKDAVEPQ
jgi:hypothetical protein